MASIGWGSCAEPGSAPAQEAAPSALRFGTHNHLTAKAAVDDAFPNTTGTESSACGEAGSRHTYEDIKMTDTGAIPKSAPRSRRADDRWMRSILRGQKFEGRGFSRCTVDALLAHGISAPERLLFMTEIELQNIPGIGAISLAEILRYRKQHCSGA